MFNQRFLYTSVHLAFYFVLELVVWTGSLLIGAGICRIVMLLTNQEMIYSQANQKKHLIYWRDPQLTYIIDFKSRSAYWLIVHNLTYIDETPIW